MEQRGETTDQRLHQEAVAPGRLVVLDGDVKRLIGADNHTELLRPGQGGVEEVPLKQYVMLGQEGHDHGLVLAALGFMYGDGIGGGDVVKVVLLKTDLAAGGNRPQPEVR